MIEVDAGYVVGFKNDYSKTIEYAYHDGGDVYPPIGAQGRALMCETIKHAKRYPTLHEIRDDLGQYIFSQVNRPESAYVKQALGKLRQVGTAQKELDETKVFHPEIQTKTIGDVVIHRVDLRLEPVNISVCDIDIARYHCLVKAGAHTRPRVIDDEAGVHDTFGPLDEPFGDRDFDVPQGYQEGGYLLLDRDFFERCDDPGFIASGGEASFWGPADGKRQPSYSRIPISAARPGWDWKTMRHDWNTVKSERHQRDIPSLFTVVSNLYLQPIEKDFVQKVVPVRADIKAVPLDPEALEFLFQVEESIGVGPASRPELTATMHALHRLTRR